jgi:chaperonin GroES
MNFTPYGDYLLLKENERVEKTKSGIIMLDGANGDYIYAEVVAAGSGVYTTAGVRIPMSVASGDVVVMHKSYAGDQKKVKIEDVEYLIVRESEIAMIKNK